MKMIVPLVLVLSLPLAAAETSELARARRILERVPLVDGHNDLPWEIHQRYKNALERIRLDESLAGVIPPGSTRAVHTDIPRLRAGGVGAQFWSVYVPATLPGGEAVQATIDQIDLVKRMVTAYPATFEMASTAADIERTHRQGRIASLLGIEGGSSINNSLATLRQMWELGVRYMTLTHSENNDWADSGTADPKHNGLTPFGREVVREMNRLGMLVDLSHVSEKTMHDALDTTSSPVVFSHSSARSIASHPRNVPDSVLKRIPANRGVVMVTFVQPYVSDAVFEYSARRKGEEARLKELYSGNPDGFKAAFEKWEKENPAPRSTIEEVADHIDHIRKIAGIDHIGIGSDFDGIRTTPRGLDDVSAFPNLFAELLRRGYSESDLEKIAGRNILRVMTENETIAAKLQRERGPSERLFER